MTTISPCLQFRGNWLRVLAVMSCVLFYATADICIAGTTVQVEGKNVRFINRQTGNVVATLLAPEAGFRSGQTLLSSSQQAQCPAPSKDGTAGKPLELLEVKREGKTIITRWGGNPFFEIWLTFDHITEPECVRMRLAGKWVGKNMDNKGTGLEVWVRIPLRITGGAIQSGQAFLREDWDCQWSNFTVKDRWLGQWGCSAFHFEDDAKEMVLPVASFSTESEYNLIALVEPRSAFNLGVRNDRLFFSRKLFILPETGAKDESIDLKDGLPPAYHEIYIGSEKKPSWNLLYWDYLLTVSPQLAQPPTVQLPNAVMTGGVSNFPFTQRWAKRLYSFGLRNLYIGTKVHLTEEYLRRTGQLVPSEAKKLGMLTAIGLDRYASDPKKEAGYGIPEGSQLQGLTWENVKDSLVTQSDGTPCDVWSGMEVNMSPEFSYSRRLLSVLEKRLNDFKYDGAFVDYYLDSRDADESHNYGRYPFYPQIVSESWFMRQLSELVHKQGKYFQMNCPAPQLISTNRFWDIISGDVPLTILLMQKLQAVYKPSVYYGNSNVKGHAFTTEGWLRDAFRGLLYGCAVSPWAFQPEGADSITNNVFYLLDVERGRPLFARNGCLMSRLAGAALCDGDLKEMTWTAFRHPEGSRYFVTSNATDESLRRSISLAGAKLELDKNSVYALIEWDLEQGGQVLAKDITAEKLLKTWTVELEPYEIKLLCIEPMEGREDIIRLDYFAHISDQFPWLKSATDEVLSTEVAGNPEYISFTIKGQSEIQFEAQFGYLLAGKPHFVSVVGAQEYAVEMKDGIIKVWGTQDADSTVISFDGGDGIPLVLMEGRILRVSDAFVDTPVAYDLKQGGLGDWLFTGGTWSFQSGDALYQSNIQPDWSSATLKVPWSGDYELTFRTTMQRDTDSAQKPELKFSIGEVQDMDVFIAGHNYTFPSLWIGDEVAKRGLDLALYPNQYQSYSRAYDWRVRKQGNLVTLSISYDNGNTYETFLDWQSDNTFQPAFKIFCRNASLLLGQVKLKTTSGQ